MKRAGYKNGITWSEKRQNILRKIPTEIQSWGSGEANILLSSALIPAKEYGFRIQCGNRESAGPGTWSIFFFRLRGDTPKECFFLLLRFLIHLQPSKARKSSRGRLAHKEIDFSGISWSLGFHSEEVQDLVFQMIFACDCLYFFPMAFF